jgi:hypothetical protein
MDKRQEILDLHVGTSAAETVTLSHESILIEGRGDLEITDYRVTSHTPI